MKISEAMSKKLLKICDERGMSVNKLATTCLLTQSTVQNIIEIGFVLAIILIYSI